MAHWLLGLTTLGFMVNTRTAIQCLGLVTDFSSSDGGVRRGSREWDTRDSFCHLPVNHTASAVRLLLLLLLLWDTWSPTAKKTQLGNQPGNVICASLQTALNIRGIIHTNWCYTGPLLAPGSSKIRDEDVMFCEHVTVVLRVGLLLARLQ